MKQSIKKYRTKIIDRGVLNLFGFFSFFFFHSELFCVRIFVDGRRLCTKMYGCLFIERKGQKFQFFCAEI